AAQATTRVRLGPGVTNSVTRDPAVTASAALALQAESGGRAVLGIGRGDSSVQRIGKREDRLAPFERYLAAVQRYLRGEVVDRDGFASRLEWLERVQAPKVPVEVAATGPRVIEVAARHADAICLAVGADPAHLGAVLAHARAAARAAGRDPRVLRYGAFVTAVIHDDVRVAREAVRGAAASFARFSAFAGSDLARLPAPLAAAARYLRQHYDMRNPARHDGRHQIVRLMHFHRGLVDGQLPVRWAGTALCGYGYPLFVFTYRLPFWLAELWYLASGSLGDAIKATFVVTFLASGVTMYWLAHLLTASPLAAFG